MPTRLDDFEIAGQHEKILLYGESGTGKTELWATAPDPIYALIFGPPNEVKTLMSPGFNERKGHRSITFDAVTEEFGTRGRFKSAEAFDKACDALDNAWEARRKGDLAFETLVVENVSTLLWVQANKILEVSGVGDRESKSLTRFRDNNILFLADSDYMGMQSLMRQFVNWIYNLPIHVIFVAHEHVDAVTDRKTREKIIHSISPNFIGKQRSDIPNMFDNVWRTTVQGGGRSSLFQVQTVGDDTVLAKTRMGGILKERVTNMNIEKAISFFAKAVT